MGPVAAVENLVIVGHAVGGLQLLPAWLQAAAFHVVTSCSQGVIDSC